MPVAKNDEDERVGLCVYVQFNFLKNTYTKKHKKSHGFTYLQSMDFQREPQSKHHLHCEQEKPAHCYGSLLLRLGTHQIQNRTRYNNILVK